MTLIFLFVFVALTVIFLLMWLDERGENQHVAMILKEHEQHIREIHETNSRQRSHLLNLWQKEREALREIIYELKREDD